MIDGDRLRVAAGIALALAIASGAACSRRPGAPAVPAPGADAPSAIAGLGVSFAPPRGWTAADRAALDDARKKGAGQAQLGCFDADIAAAFFGPDGEQFVVSRLAPNGGYRSGQSTASQLGRHAAIVESYFAAEGRAVLDRIEINDFTVFRVTGAYGTDVFSKYFFVKAADDAARAFSIDVIVPSAAYAEATGRIVDESLRSFRRD